MKRVGDDQTGADDSPLIDMSLPERTEGWEQKSSEIVSVSPLEGTVMLYEMEHSVLAAHTSRGMLWLQVKPATGEFKVSYGVNRDGTIAQVRPLEGEGGGSSCRSNHQSCAVLLGTRAVSSS